MLAKEINQVYETSAEREVRGMATGVGWELDEGTFRASYCIGRDTQKGQSTKDHF